MSKKFKAEVRTEVVMDENEYVAHLNDRIEMYSRLIQGEIDAINKAKIRGEKKIADYAKIRGDIMEEKQKVKDGRSSNEVK